MSRNVQKNIKETKENQRNKRTLEILELSLSDPISDKCDNKKYHKFVNVK